MAVVALHSSEIREIRDALIPLLVAAGLYSLGIDGHPIANTLDYLMVTPTNAFWALLSLVLNTAGGTAAIWVFKRSIRNFILRFESDLLGDVKFEPSNAIPLSDFLLPHEVPVPSDDSEEGNEADVGLPPGQQASSSSERTLFFTPNTVAALGTGFQTSQLS
jgi:hypothetical protein